jgi:hypothetical protein
MSVVESKLEMLNTIVKSKLKHRVYAAFYNWKKPPKDAKNIKLLKSKMLKSSQLTSQLKKRISDHSSDSRSDNSLAKLIELNKQLKQKLASTELSVGQFIKDMSSLLDQHEPRHSQEDMISKLNNRLKNRTKSKYINPSPEREKSKKDKRGYMRVNFD